MTTASAIEPHWASAPSRTVLRLLSQRGMTVEDLADSTSLTDAQARGLVTGATGINEDVARELSGVLGASVRFWMARDADYHESRYWLDVDEISGRLPVKQLTELGWMERGSTWRERAKIFLDYFDVETADEWNRTHGSRIESSRFRASATSPRDDVAVAAWLRRAAVQAKEITLPVWNPVRFEESLPEIRRLTRTANPDRFIPELVRCAAASGLAVVVLRALPKSPASGAAFLGDHGAPVIALSGRGLTDDKLWFTFFHEASHVLKDDLTKPYIEDFDARGLSSAPEESAADHFAANLLIPGGADRYFDPLRKPRAREIAKVASELGIAPGIVVGALQHLDVLAWSALGSLKRHYRWDGSTLKISHTS